MVRGSVWLWLGTATGLWLENNGCRCNGPNPANYSGWEGEGVFGCGRARTNTQPLLGLVDKVPPRLGCDILRQSHMSDMDFATFCDILWQFATVAYVGYRFSFLWHFAKFLRHFTTFGYVTKCRILVWGGGPYWGSRVLLAYYLSMQIDVLFIRRQNTVHGKLVWHTAVLENGCSNSQKYILNTLFNIGSGSQNPVINCCFVFFPVSLGPFPPLRENPVVNILGENEHKLNSVR